MRFAILLAAPVFCRFWQALYDRSSARERQAARFKIPEAAAVALDPELSYFMRAVFEALRLWPPIRLRACARYIIIRTGRALCLRQKTLIPPLTFS
jgi:hypothetical protein